MYDLSASNERAYFCIDLVITVCCACTLLCSLFAWIEQATASQSSCRLSPAPKKSLTTRYSSSNLFRAYSCTSTMMRPQKTSTETVCEDLTLIRDVCSTLRRLCTTSWASNLGVNMILLPHEHTHRDFTYFQSAGVSICPPTPLKMTHTDSQ